MERGILGVNCCVCEREKRKIWNGLLLGIKFDENWKIIRIKNCKLLFDHAANNFFFFDKVSDIKQYKFTLFYTPFQFKNKVLSVNNEHHNNFSLNNSNMM